MKNREIRIYDLRKSDDGKYLKNEIKSDHKRNFACIVRLSKKHYITLLIESEKSDRNGYHLRFIYVMNPTFEKRSLKKLNWLTGVIDRCIYKLNLIQCPKQKLMSEDSLLHAFFNASACQWAVRTIIGNF